MSEGDKVWCENCQAFQPVKRAVNDDDCYDLLCGRCSWVVATVRSRPSEFVDEPLYSVLEVEPL